MCSSKVERGDHMEDVLLVDDERPVLDSLLSALDWAEYGFKQIHTAQSAQEALDILASHRIDLLITDILMPGMSGLEMLRIVRSRFPSAHCVLLTAHSKFEFAREALQLGVENYLLKPIDINELRETVYRSIKNIDYINAISHDLYDRNILVRWLHGRISSDELLEHSRYTKLNVLLRRYRVLYVKTAANVQLLLNCLGTCFSLNFTVHALPMDERSGYLLVGGRDIPEDMLCDSIHDALHQWKDALVVCGSQATGSGEVVQSRSDAIYTAEYARLAGLSGWISSDAPHPSLLSPHASAQLESIVQLEHPQAKAQAWIDSQTASLERAMLPRLYAQACLLMSHLLNGSNGSAPQAHAMPDFTGPETIANTSALLMNAILEANQHFLKGRQEISPVIARVLQYVTENLNGSISIKQFSEHTKMNPTYIGRLFKDEMGMYFSDYVCLTRINKAKTLLETTTLSVGDIARQVGIYDVSYFTQCFKKQERIAPLKYRQQKNTK